MSYGRKFSTYEMDVQVSHSILSKYRRKVIYNKLRADIQQNIRDLCKWKGVEIIEGHMMPDHVHLLLSIAKYIREQEKQNQIEDKLYTKEYEDPFKGKAK